MIDFESLQIDKLVLHKIGNRMRDEGIQISHELHSLDDSNIKELMLKFFLRPFKSERQFSFFHESKLDLNEVYYFVREIFYQPDRFYDESIKILKHLYEKSNHPQIKSGEFYMSYFKDYSLTNKKIDVVGIFKTENKDTYLKVNQRHNSFDISYDKGINMDKLDKGCLIFNEGQENGYRVLIIDASANSQNNEAQYWKKNFLKLKELETESSTTNAFIRICSGFSSSMAENSTGSNSFNDTLNFRNSAYKYLEENSTYTLDDFVQKVFDNENLSAEFKEYKKMYEEMNQLVPINSFSVSSPTVAKLKKKFVSNVKLDTGFDIKITDSRYIEKGFDKEKGMSFYKLYFHGEK